MATRTGLSAKRFGELTGVEARGIAASSGEVGG